LRALLSTSIPTVFQTKITDRTGSISFNPQLRSVNLSLILFTVLVVLGCMTVEVQSLLCNKDASKLNGVCGKPAKGNSGRFLSDE
jgi:hypothetical protein